MKLAAFRIQNFRSIIDTGWCAFSRDRITVLVGQNESGKTTVLEALHALLGDRDVTADDRRTACPPPVFEVRVHITIGELQGALTNCRTEQTAVLTNHLTTTNDQLDVRLEFQEPKNPGDHFDYSWSFPDETLGSRLDEAWDRIPLTSAEAESAEAPQVERLTTDSLVTHLLNLMPETTLFSANRGLLPNQIDIGPESKLSGREGVAANNFLAVAGLDLSKLRSVDRRAREYMLERANESISADFNQFWTQTIGHKNRLSIRCDYEHYGSEAGEKSGQPHLVFWIGDGRTTLYPRQRSEGVRWFVSFYLQLRASERGKTQRLFLLDEPGANLHPRAQEDVLRLINKLSADIQIVYSTHSASLLEYTKLYRVHAVQRTDDIDSPTVVIDAHRLGAASTDTLSPLLMAMGTDFSHQQVVQKRYNVILEEVGAFYYFQAFWRLCGRTDEAYFIAASGASNIPMMANMFRGWGLRFIAVMDDDTRGRGVYKDLKRDLFGDDETLAEASLYRIKGCSGIEDVFSPTDFKRHVLREDVELKDKNTTYLRNTKRSKPVMAYQVLDDLLQGRTSRDDYEEATLEKVADVCAEVCARLAKH